MQFPGDQSPAEGGYQPPSGYRGIAEAWEELNQDKGLNWAGQVPSTPDFGPDTSAPAVIQGTPPPTGWGKRVCMHRGEGLCAWCIHIEVCMGVLLQGVRHV